MKGPASEGLPPPDPAAELETLRARLAETEEALRAIRSGDVDAVVVTGGGGDRLYTLAGADSIYRRLFETMSEGAMTLSADGVILYCNARVAEMLGKPLDRVLGSTLRDHLPPADQQVLAAMLARARSETSRQEIHLMDGAGGLVPVYLSTSRLESEGTRMVSCLVLTDLTEQKSHRKVVEAERLARLILEQAAGPIVVCDGDGRVIRASEAALRFCDGSPLLRLFAEVFPLRTGGSGPFRIAAVLAGETLRDVDVFLDRDGRVHDLILNAGPLHGGAEILGCVVTLTDITGRRRDESSLRLQGAALNAASNAILITDPAGGIEWVNPAFTAYTGYGAEESIGRNVRMLRSGRHPPGFYGEIWNTILAGDVWRGELVNRRKDGSLYTEEMTITPLKDALGGIAHFIAVKQDISQRLALEGQFRQAQKMEAVGRLAGGVAHDFNNMLSVILGYGEMAMAGLRPGDPLREHVTEILKAGERSAALTRQLLAFSRKQTLQPEVVDLNPLLKDLQRMLARVIGEDVELALVLGPDLGRVLVDRGQMEQVLMNLVVNSRDAMATGGTVTIETANADLDDAYVRVHPGAVPGRYVMASVADTGCGMEGETLSRIFEPFFTTKESGKGTGLGLAMVYGIVKQSSGYISVESEPGRGTTFRVYLPRTEAPEEARPEAHAQVAALGGGQNILVVEDEEAVRGLMGGMLTAMDYRVTIAANAGEALLLIEEKFLVPDLLITDLVMPGMGGEALVVRLRRLHPGLRVLLMSGYTGNAIGQSGELDPATPFIRKPFTVKEMVLKVEQVLQGSAIARAPTVAGA